MRMLFALSLLASACASQTPAPASAPNVHARLATPTRLFVLATASTGAITARRYTHDGWQSSAVALAFAGGDITATATTAGQLAVTELALDLEPIDIPQSVFGKPARLERVRLSLAKPAAPVDAAWIDANDATATAQLALDLSWSIEIDGNGTPLGTQHLASIPTAVALSGDGARVDATLSAHASGPVWSWAGLLEFDDLDIALAAATLD
jgi:hypothetical protein